MAADMIARGMANSAQKRADSAYDLAAGRALALSVTNIQKLVSDFNTASNTYAKVGDNIYIQQLNVPDFWVFKVDTTRADYTYTTDQAFLQAIARNGYVKVGYFQISQLESKHQVTFGYYYGNQFYYNAGHTDQIVPDENGMFFDIPTKDGYVYRDGAYTQIINSTEEAERKQADLDEASARAAEDTALGGRIDSEETARANADTAEKNAREAADAQLASDLASEAATREEADDTLQANIDAEGATRASKDEELTNAILDEIYERETADEKLGKDIDAITMPRDLEMVTIGGKVHVFANGTPITINDNGSANVITWFGANSTISGNHNQVSQPNSMTVPYGALIFGGGYGKRANERNKGLYFVNSQITINGGTFERVFGGCLGTGAVGVVTITVNGGTITKGLHGGGQKGGDALMYSNSVGSVNITINGGTFSSVLTAGGVDAVNVGESKMTINGGSIKWLVASGSNGTIGQSKVVFNGGSVSEDALSVNRGYIQDVEWIINGGSINRLWSGADNDIDDNGSIAHCVINVLGGRVDELKLGYTATQLMASGTVKGTYVPGHITNEEVGVSECNLVLDADYVEHTAIRQEIVEKIDDSLYKIEFTIPATIWKQGVLGTRYLPKITFGDNISFDAGKLLILRSNDPKFVQYEVKLAGQGNDNGCGYILIDCDYYSKAEPSFPDADIDCVLYVLSLATKTTTKTNGYVEVSDEAWLDPSYIPATENVSAIITQNGSTLEVE